MIMLDASCGKCAEITKGIEQTCLHDDFLAFRTHHRFPTRRKKNRPTHFPLLIGEDPDGERRLVPVADRPIVLVMPKFPIPSVLRGGAPGEKLQGEMIVYGNREDIRARSARVVDGIVTVEGRIDPYAFVCLLAKIAHGAAVAEFGIDKFEPCLCGLILGEAPVVSAYFVGGVPPHGELPRLQTSHQVVFDFIEAGPVEYVSVRIRLFAFAPTPTYAVIAGTVPLGFMPPMRGGTPP